MQHAIRLLTDELNLQTESRIDLANYSRNVNLQSTEAKLSIAEQLADQQELINQLARAIKILEAVAE